MKKHHHGAHMCANGFTLAELTLALIIISIIMVALAPVVTKRVADNIKISNSTLSEFKLYTYDEAATDSKCTPASDGSRAYDCEFSAPSSAKSVSVVMVSGGGGGGAQKAANTCQIYQNGTWTSVSCSGAGAAGSSGQSVSGASETNAADGGAGGGGGGWSFDSVNYPTPGTGAKGQNGYVYIYWTKN